MIIARAPLRVSFGGGGTDLPAYYRRSGGIVVSVSIDKYIYVTVEPSAYGTQIASPDQGVPPVQSGPSDIPGIRLPLLVTDRCAPGQSLRIFIAGEVPSGTGLGSSSALTVALIAALSAYTGNRRTPTEVADLACTIEMDDLASPIGKQDQYASALGGLNTLTFHRDGTVGVEPLCLRPDVREALQRRLVLFFLGSRRSAGSLLATQSRQSEEREPRTIAALDAIKALALQIRGALLAGDLDRFAALLHESWMQKQRVTGGISNGYIDHCYELARHAGAAGGKVTGAGGGGFLLLYCAEERQTAVTAALNPMGLVPLQFGFSSHGAQIVVDDPALSVDHWRT